MEKLSRRSKLSNLEFLRMAEKLPPTLSEAYHSIEMIEVIENIARRYKFNKDEEWELFGVVYDTILGLLPPSEIERALGKRLNLDEDKTKFIKGELDAFVLNEIRPELDKLYGLTKEDSEEKKSDSEPKRSDPYREPSE
jgi:hypothetical protein